MNPQRRPRVGRQHHRAADDLRHRNRADVAEALLDRPLPEVCRHGGRQDLQAMSRQTAGVNGAHNLAHLAAKRDQQRSRGPRVQRYLERLAQLVVHPHVAVPAK
jgi:hypothetical protein